MCTNSACKNLSFMLVAFIVSSRLVAAFLYLLSPPVYGEGDGVLQGQGTHTSWIHRACEESSPPHL